MMSELERDFKEANKHLPIDILNQYTAIFMMGVEIGFQCAVDKLLLLNHVPPRHSQN
jgi:hypothetical protein